MAGFGISGVEPWGSAARELVKFLSALIILMRGLVNRLTLQKLVIRNSHVIKTGECMANADAVPAGGSVMWNVPSCVVLCGMNILPQYQHGGGSILCERHCIHWVMADAPSNRRLEKIS
jgi:hypothetical protein